NNGRFHHPHRLALTATSKTDLHTQLTSYLANPQTNRQSPIANPPKIAFLFTGQGSQYPNMARDLYNTQPIFRATLDECDRILRPFLPTPLLKVIFAEEEAASNKLQVASKELATCHLLHETCYTQPALFAIEYALARLWQSWGIQPAALLGHSVGEYVAACLAGVFSLEDGLRLIATRGRLMQALPSGGVMTAVFAPEATVTPLVAPFADEASIATINGAENIVISGTETAVSAVTAQLEAQGIRTQPLTVSHAFHSPLMEPMLAEFTAVASQISYQPPTIPLVSNLTGRLHKAAPDAAYWRDHLRHAVRFSDGLATLAAQDITATLEIGPKTTLTSLARRAHSEMGRGQTRTNTDGYGLMAAPLFLASLSSSQNDWQSLLNSLGQLYEAGAEVDWAAFDGDYRRRRVALPTYAFDRQRYWLDVTPATQTTTAVSPTNHLQKLPTAVPIYQMQTKWDADLPDLTDLKDQVNQDRQLNQRPISSFLHQVAAAQFGIGNHSVTTDDRPQTTNHHAPSSVVRRPSSSWVTLQAVLTPNETGAAYQLFAQISGSEEWLLLESGQLERGEVVVEQSPTDLTRADLLAADDPQSAVSRFLHATTAAILGLDPARLNPDQPLDTVGMDSLMAIELRNRVEQQLAITLSLVSFLTGPSVNGLAAQLVAHLREGGRETAVSPIPTQPNRSGEQPLTQSQQAMWFLHQLLPKGVAFNVFGAVTVRGSFDGEALRTALGQLAARHPALRTTFRFNREMEPIQIVRETINLPFYPLDGSDWDGSKVQEYLQAEANRPFDLEKGPLFRFIALRRAADEQILLLSVNHLITDFWSMSLLVAELTQLYAVARGDETVPLPDLSHHFVDYVHWQNQMLAGDEGARLKAYWLDKLSGELPRLDLPSDRPRRAQPDYGGQTITHRFDPTLLPALKKVAQAHGVTLYTALLAGFQALLHRYSGQDKILVGSVLAGRDRPELANLVGYFVNPVAMAAQFAAADSGQHTNFADLLGQVRQTVLGAFEHQAYPLPKLAADLSQTGQIRLDPGRPPLFDVMFIMQQAQVMADAGLSALALGLPGAQLALGDATLEIHHLGGLPAQFDLTLMMAETGDGLAASLHYATALFDEPTMRRLLTHLEMLLAAAVAEPQRPLIHLPLLTPAEETVLARLNQTAMDYPREQTIHGLVQAQAAKTPEKTAVIFDNQTLTYAELDQRSSQLAHYLQAQGVTTGSLIALCVERSAEMIVGLLGILKAGGSYIPLDPAFPPQRLALMLDDAQPVLVLTETAVSATLQTTIPLHPIDTIHQDTNNQSPISNLPHTAHPTPHTPAYIIYTSGSTGRPKGVAVTHRNVVNFLTSMAQQPGLTAEDVLVAVTTLSFDIAGLELFLPLTVGGTVVVASRETAVDATQLAHLLQTSQATVMQATPATWQLLLEAGWEGQDTLKILCGGEALPRQLADKLLVRCAELWNMYGPTETTIWSTCRQIFADDQPITIGKPIGNTQMYVLDGQMQPVPLGAVGDLYIGGDGVAVSYLNRPELTAERFVADPQRGRLYKTGDLARILPSGDIIFLGRNDFQVKIRGYRIELGDIEAALEQETAVSQAIVVAREDKPQPKRLVAYYTLADGHAEPTASDLRQALQTTLPDYMLPAQFVRLAQWPLTPNGKIDRKALPAPAFSREALGSYVPPRDEIEAELAALCAAVLGVKQIGIHDSFFDLGGNSLLATQLIFQVRNRYQVQIPLRLVFGQPTVAGLAKIVRRGGADVLAIDAEEVKEMLADARLDPTIHVNGQPKPAPTQPRHVLLTGATGFLGAYLLHDLLALTDATVHCLIRAKSEEDALARLAKNMAFYQQWNQAHADRIKIVLGNLALPQMGLTEAQFGQLAEQMDVIYHNGAMVNMVYSYGAHKEANVGGTEAILTLASQTRLKPVHFVSTLAIFNRAEANGEPFHEGQRSTDLPVPMGGYAQSKWVAERLVQTAVDRGIPVAIYRPGVISGDSRTGFANSDDMVSTLAQACLSLGIVPNLDVMVNITPVDFVSQALVRLSLKPESLGKIFHLANWNPMPYQELLAWMETLGYGLERISFEAWRDRLVSLAPTLEEMAGWVPALPLIEEATAEQVFMPLFDYGNTINGLADSSLTCPPVGSKLLSTYMLYYGQQVNGVGD
ncbi:MAG: amino acid adenylation domain-containing protein, partial [Anaerolineales bacterium]|nr:amino acid adenylation domain-containing protein [Anaerolineales bacterium]